MKKLTNKEEDIMRVIWKLGRVQVREILDEIPETYYHYNTISTVVRHLEDKEYVAHNPQGNSYTYFPIISEERYKRRLMSTISEKFFEDSYKNMIAFLVKEEKINTSELREIIKSVEEGETE